MTMFGTRGRSATALRSTAAAFTAALALTALPAQTATAAPAGDEEQRMAQEAFDAMCPAEPVEHEADWYTAVDSWQSMQPYDWRGYKAAHREARSKLYGDPAFNEDTRVAMCEGMVAYGDELKNQTLDRKGDLKNGCATVAGMTAFYEHKITALRAIQANNWPEVDKLVPGWRDPAQFVRDYHKVTCTNLTGVSD
ncbi:hypothetical protein P8605_42470 [Streptomyces sp. T-3]|nr:hypothetical protein [Streptomyces sp. T-3]